MKLSEIAFCLQYAFLSRAQKVDIQYQIDHQRDIMKVMSVLPGKYRYEQVDAAINASGVVPEQVYRSLAAGESTEVLACFYGALHGPGHENTALVR
jgi:hypothetical protein